MKLYLSSYHLGNEPEQLTALLGENKRAAVIPNALDYSTDQERLAKSRQREFDELSAIGLAPEEIDLRQYFGRSAALKQDLMGYGLFGFGEETPLS